MSRPLAPAAAPPRRRAPAPARFAGWLALAVAAACSSGVPAEAGFDEPLLVNGGQFLGGALPGSPPVEGGAPAPAAGPAVTLVEATSRLVFPGEGGKVFTGRTTPDARSLALSFADLGTGHWVVPVGGPDPQAGGELTWQVTCDFGADVPPGPHTLRFVALDDRGAAGAWRELSVCVPSGAPGDLSACDPAAAPPPALLSLEWDRDVDLDLEVVTPSGRRLGPKRLATSVPGPGGPAATGAIERDARRDCSTAGARREDLVWRAEPEPGLYLVYANLFDACGEPAVRFRASLSIAEPSPEGPPRLVERLERAGILTDLDANGGAGPGLFVAEFAFQLSEGRLVPCSSNASCASRSSAARGCSTCCSRSRSPRSPRRSTASASSAATATTRTRSRAACAPRCSRTTSRPPTRRSPRAPRSRRASCAPPSASAPAAPAPSPTRSRASSGASAPRSSAG